MWWHSARSTALCQTEAFAPIATAPKSCAEGAIHADGSTTGVEVNLVAGTGSGSDAQGDVLSAIENVVGSSFSDRLTGNAVANALSGRAGIDTLIGNGGIDTLGGEEGDDLLIDGGGTFADTYIGGNGEDTISYQTSTARVVVNLTTGVGNGGSGADSNLDTYSPSEAHSAPHILNLDQARPEQLAEFFRAPEPVSAAWRSFTWDKLAALCRMPLEGTSFGAAEARAA